MRLRANNWALPTILGVFFVAFTGFFAWITHIVVCIQALAGSKAMSAAILLGIGIFVPPIGVIHGIMVWLGSGLF